MVRITNAHLRNIQRWLQQHIACNLRDVAKKSRVLTSKLPGTSKWFQRRSRWVRQDVDDRDRRFVTVILTALSKRDARKFRSPRSSTRAAHTFNNRFVKGAAFSAIHCVGRLALRPVRTKTLNRKVSGSCRETIRSHFSLGWWRRMIVSRLFSHGFIGWMVDAQSKRAINDS